MHCNLRPPDATTVLLRFKYDTHDKFEVAQPTSIRCRIIAFLLLIYLTFRCDLLSTILLSYSKELNESQDTVTFYIAYTFFISTETGRILARTQGDHGYTRSLFQSSDILLHF